MTKLSKNIIYNLLGQGLLLILSFVAVRCVFRQLGNEVLGLIYFVSAMNLIIIGAVEMGLSSTTVREISGHLPNELAYVQDLIRTASSFYWGGYLLLTVGTYCLAPFLAAKWINLKSLDLATATLALRVMGIGTLLVFPVTFYTSVLQGLQRMEFNNLIDVATVALRQFGTIVVVVQGGRLLHIACWYGACSVLSVLAYIAICAHFLSFRSLVPGFSVSVVRRNFPYSSKMAVVSFLAMIHNQADRAIVSKLLPMGIFGYYALASNTVARGTMLTSSVSLAAFPAFSALFKGGDRRALMSQYWKLQDLLCYALVPLFAAIPFAAGPLFSYLLNADAARMLLLPTTFLCVGFYMHGTLNVPYFLSLAVGRPGIPARLNLYALFAVLPGTIILVRFFGLNGAGLSWVLYHIFAYAYAVPRICSECLGIASWKWYVHVLKIFLLAWLTYGGAWIALRSIGAHSIASLALGYTAGSLAFLGLACLFMGDELRASLHQLPAALRARALEAF